MTLNDLLRLTVVKDRIVSSFYHFHMMQNVVAQSFC